MNIFRTLFGSKDRDPEAKKREEEEKQFDILKYDGVRALKSGQAAYAVLCLLHALEKQEDLECRDYLFQAYMRQGQVREAYEQLLKMSEAHPDNVRILLQMASLCYMMEDYAAMADACEKSLLVDDANEQAYYFYAQACHAQGDDSNAVAMLTKCIQLRADFAEAYLLRGDVYRQSGQLAEAWEDASWLLEHVADSEDVLLLAARVMMAKDDKEGAKAYYDRVIAVDPFCLEALRERSAVRRDLGDESGAQEDEAQVEELSAKGQSVHENIEQETRDAYKKNDVYGVFS